MIKRSNGGFEIYGYSKEAGWKLTTLEGNWDNLFSNVKKNDEIVFNTSKNFKLFRAIKFYKGHIHNNILKIKRELKQRINEKNLEENLNLFLPAIKNWLKIHVIQEADKF